MGNVDGIDSDSITPQNIQTISDLLKVFSKEPWAQDVLCAMSNGQAFAEKYYPQVTEAVGKSPTEGQCPTKAFSGDSHPCGHESFFFGSDNLADCLVSRTPSAIWIGDNGQLTPNTLAMFALTKSKGIKYLIHMKTTASWLLRDVEDYYSIYESLRAETLCLKTGAISSPFLNPDFASLIVSRKALRDTVLANGRAYYERLGIVFSDDQAPENNARNNVLAMAAQHLMWDVEAGKNADAPTIVPVLQDAANKRHYLWNPKTKNFIQLMTLEHRLGRVSQQSAMMRTRVLKHFMKQLPFEKGDKKSESEWQDIAVMLMNGYTEYVKDTQIIKTIAKSYKQIVFWVGCADSRVNLLAVLGKTASRLLRPTLRLVGGILTSPDGKLVEEARLAAAYAKANGWVFAHSHHSNCGAMGNLYTYLSDPEGQGKAIPEAFQSMGENNRELYVKVSSAGLTSSEIKAAYHAGTGIKPVKVDDCLGLEQLKIDRRALVDAIPDIKLLSTYVDVANCQIYVREPRGERMLPVRAIGNCQVVCGPARPDVAIQQQVQALQPRLTQ